MKWLSALLLILLPLLALVLNHDVISTLLIVVWTMGIIPLCVICFIPNRARSMRADRRK